MPGMASTKFRERQAAILCSEPHNRHWANRCQNFDGNKGWGWSERLSSWHELNCAWVLGTRSLRLDHFGRAVGDLIAYYPDSGRLRLLPTVRLVTTADASVRVILRPGEVE
jgi:hypothetical protein